MRSCTENFKTSKNKRNCNKPITGDTQTVMVQHTIASLFTLVSECWVNYTHIYIYISCHYLRHIISHFCAVLWEVSAGGLTYSVGCYLNSFVKEHCAVLCIRLDLMVISAACELFDLSGGNGTILH